MRVKGGDRLGLRFGDRQHGAVEIVGGGVIRGAVVGSGAAANERDDERRERYDLSWFSWFVSLGSWW